MSIVLLLIPLGLVLVAVAACALFWAVDSGQYDGDVEAQGLIAVERDEPLTSGQVRIALRECKS